MTATRINVPLDDSMHSQSHARLLDAILAGCFWDWLEQELNIQWVIVVAAAEVQRRAPRISNGKTHDDLMSAMSENNNNNNNFN